MNQKVLKELEVISVIIPVYNVKKYLSQCIESVIHQTYSQLEIILVDDGSTDGSIEICNQYKQEDNRIKVIHKENGGVSSARNKGLKIASGAYITFVDSDDYLLPTCLEKMYRGICKNKVDCAMVGWKNQDGELGEIKNFVSEDKSIIFEKDKIPEISLVGTVWGHLFKKEFLRGICFDENIFYSEDTLFTVRSLYATCAKKILVIGEPLYVYRMNRGSSAINSSFCEKQLTIINAYNQMLEFVKQYENIWRLIKRNKKIHCFRMYRSVLELDYKKRYKEAYDILKDEIIELRKEGYKPVDKKENIIELLYLHFYGIFRYYIKQRYY